jgi:hypothetical protein
MPGENTPAAKSGQFWVRTPQVPTTDKKAGAITADTQAKITVMMPIANRSELVGSRMGIWHNDFCLYTTLYTLLDNAKKSGQFWIRTLAV